MSGQNKIAEIIPNKLYWISDRAPPKNQSNSFYFCIDNELVYQPFCSDFGPLNLAMIHKFCSELERLLSNPTYTSYKIFHYTSLLPAKRSNAALLMGAFQILVLHRTAHESWAPFAAFPPFLEYRDAGYGSCTYKCSLAHCLGGLETGVRLGWFNMRTFNVQEYEFYEKVENGDWNWVVPNKFLAFACPANVATDSEGFRVWTPEKFCELFHSIGVTAVVRLNNKTYDEERFKRNGIRHYDLFYVDGSCPSEKLILDFLKIAEREPIMAVHCKAGLGRTGTLIGCYCMKHHGFNAAEFIGWARLSRPGSVLGPQQQFLNEAQEKCYRWGNEFRSGDVTGGMRNLSVKEHIEESKVQMSPEEKRVKVHGDHGQAERLINAKRYNQSPDSSPVSPGKNKRDNIFKK